MLSLATFGRSYLNETVSARGGARVRIVERPGRWMTPPQLEALVADLQRIVRAATPAGALGYGAASGDRERLDSAIITIVYDSRDTPVAFNALTLIPCELRGRPVDVLHLGLVMGGPGVSRWRTVGRAVRPHGDPPLRAAADAPALGE